MIPYAYIHLEHIPALPACDAAPEVVAVRIAYTASRVLPDQMFTVSCAAENEIADVRVVRPGETIPGSSRIAAARGVYVFMVALNHDFRTDDYLELHLYRRGYQAMTFDGKNGGQNVAWVNAQSGEQKEAAIDALAVAGRALHLKAVPVEAIAPLGAYTSRRSVQLRAILIAEYALLAMEHDLEPGVRDRVQHKMAKLSRGGTPLRPPRSDESSMGPPVSVPDGMRYDTTVQGQ